MRRIAWIGLILVACANPAEDPEDAGTPDTGVEEDAGSTSDAGTHDAGFVDAGMFDGGTEDAGTPDAGSADSGPRVVEIRLAYGAAAEDPGLAHLYLTSSSTARVRLTPDLAGGPTIGGKGEPIIAGVDDFEWTDDGQTIFYAAQQDTFDFYELFLLDGLGTQVTTKLSVEGGGSQVRNWERSPASTWLSFTQAPAGQTLGVRYAIDSSQPAAPAVISVGSGGVARWSPVGPQLVFQDIIVSASDRDLWHVDLGVTPAVRTRVNAGANLGFGGSVSWSSDGTQIAYSADETALRLFELWRVAVNGATLGARERVTAPFPTNADIIGLDRIKYAPTGNLLAYMANTEDVTVTDLFVVDASMPAPIVPVKVTSTFPSGARGVRNFTWSADGTRIFYVADQETANEFDLFVTAATAANGVRTHDAGGNVSHATLVRNDTLLLYSRQVAGVRHLFVLDVSTSPFPAPVDLGVLDPFVPFALFEVSPSEDFVIHPTNDGRLVVSDLTQTPTIASSFTTYPTQFSRDPLWCWSPSDELVIVGQDGHLYLVEDLSTGAVFRVSGPIVNGGRATGCRFPPPSPVGN